MPIYVTRPSMPDIVDYMEEIRPIFESHVLTNMGPVYKKLQKMLIEYLDVPELSLFVNGHLALELAIQALGLRERGKELGGGEVITTPFTLCPPCTPLPGTT
jgi:dTDP-4-amino-4,6-dideoxygalactose transaminase